MIPLVNPALARQSSAAREPWLGGIIRWIVVVLALVAVLDAAYLTWTSLNHDVVAGCDGSTPGGCDDVLTSRWSRVVGLPVALPGLVTYAALLALALLAGSRTFNDNRALGTALTTIALLAAGTGLWFTILQIFVLQAFCFYCLGIHLCGLAIAGLVLWSIFGRQDKQVAASRSHVALAAIPGAAGTRRVAVPPSSEGPWLALAAPLAGGLLLLLIAIQVLFPPNTFQASNPVLAQTVDMTAPDDESTDTADNLSPTAHEHVVNRVDSEDPGDDEQPDPVKAEELAPDRSAESTAVDTKTKAETKNTSPADEAPALTRTVTLLNGKLRMNIYDEAVIGSPEAKYVVVELMDYTCPHCRKMHAHIREGIDRYGDQLAVVIMPVPLELECNSQVAVTDPAHRGACKMSKVAMAVAKVDPVKFVDFHDFLLADPDKPPSAVQAVGRAFRLVDRQALTKLTRGTTLDARIQKYIKLFSTLSAEHRAKSTATFGLPVQIVGDTVLSGGDVTSEDMFAAWEKALGIKPE